MCDKSLHLPHPTTPYRPSLRHALALTVASLLLSACASRPSPATTLASAYHESADRYLQSCRATPEACNDAEEATVMRLYAQAWSAARYQRGTRAYLMEHDRMWRLIVCGLRNGSGCDLAGVDINTYWTELGYLDRRTSP